MNIALRAHAFGKKITLYTAAFVLAVSSLTALVPFVLSERVDAAPIITTTTMATVDNYTDLVAVLNNPAYAAVNTINLTENITAAAQLNFSRPLTLNGNGNTITAGFNGSPSNDSVITASKPVTIVNLKVDGASRSNVQGIQVYATTATLTGVSIMNNKKAGLNVNGSDVTITNIVTSNNGASFGGIHLSQGGGVTTAPKVTINGQSVQSESRDIYTDKNTVAVVNDIKNQYTKTSSILRWGIWTLNAAPAAPVITSPTTGEVVTNPSTALTWEAATYASTYDMILDGVTYTGLTGTSYAMSLTEGPHTVKLRSVAASGLAGAWGTELTFTADLNDVPIVTVSTPAAGGVVSTTLPANLNKLKINGTFTDDVAVNYLTFQLVKDGVSVAIEAMHYNNPGLNPTTGAFTYNMTVPANLASGTYSLFYTGTDFQNGVTARFERVFTVDNDMPVVALVTPANNAIVHGTQRFTVESNEDISKWLFSLNGKAYGPLLQRDGISNTWYVDINTNTIPDGEYSVTLRATDLAGNTRYWNNRGDVHKFTIDNTTPTANITSHAVLGDTVTFEGEVADANLNYYYCYLTTNQLVVIDGHTFTPGQEVRLNNDTTSSRNAACVTTWANGATTIDGVLGGFNIAGVPDGSYTINLVAMDRATNSSAATLATYTFDLDRTAPAVEISSATANRVEGTGEAGSTVILTVNGVSLAPVTVSAAGTWFHNFVPALVAGNYIIVATAQDTAGNSSAPQTTVVTVSAPTAPVVPVAPTAPVATPAATPFLAQNNAPSVLGDQTSSTPEANTSDDESDSNGKAETKGATDTVAQAAGDSDGTIWGVAWYWWLLIAAAALAFFWWLIAAIRRRKDEE